MILRNRIPAYAGADRMLGYLADASATTSNEASARSPIDLGHEQIEALADLLFGASAEEPLELLRQACQRFTEA